MNCGGGWTQAATLVQSHVQTQFSWKVISSPTQKPFQLVSVQFLKLSIVPVKFGLSPSSQTRQNTVTLSQFRLTQQPRQTWLLVEVPE